MWRYRNNRDGTTVVCIACGTSLPRSETREYDKEGNRWDRHDKSFEHLCKECYRGLCHQPRDELEGLLIDVERAVDAERGAEGSVGPDCGRADGGADQSGDTDRTFLAEYFSAVEERYGPAEGPGHES